MPRLTRIRPDFGLPLPVRGDSFLEALHARLERDDAPFEGQVLQGHACLRIPESQRSLLSPHLELEVREEATCQVLRGRFSPRPTIWTGFMAVFAFIAMLGLAGVVWGLAQMTLGGGAVWLLSGPAALALIAFVYGAAFIGQGLSSDEMFGLRDYVQQLVRDLEADAGEPRRR